MKMSYELKIDPKTRAAGRFIGAVRKALISAALDEKELRGLSQQNVADCLGVNRSVINRMLKGEVNLTLRSVAELAWAMGWEPNFTLKRKDADKLQNSADEIAPYHDSPRLSPQSPAHVNITYSSGTISPPSPKNYYSVAAE